MKYSLHVVRLLIALAAFPVAFLATRPLGEWGDLVAVLVAIPVAGIVLIARLRHVQPIVHSIVSCSLGTFGGLFFCPPVQAAFAPTDELRFMVSGAVIGWVAGHFVGRRDDTPEMAAY